MSLISSFVAGGIFSFIGFYQFDGVFLLALGVILIGCGYILIKDYKKHLDRIKKKYELEIEIHQKSKKKEE